MATTSTSRTNNAVELKESRYVQGGLTNRYPNRLGWWERRQIPTSDSDITITIQNDEQHRPDLVAYRMYGKATLAWIVLQYNNIVDIQTEFVEGKQLRLPTQRRLTLDLMTQSTGGRRVY